MVSDGKKIKKKTEKQNLKLQQEKFCQLFVSGDKEFFGNGVQCYLKVYNIDKKKPNWYKTACVCASQNLSKPRVFNRISELLEEKGLNDQNVDKQLLYLINQYSDNTSKLGAIREYNKLKQRIIDRIEGSIEVKSYKWEEYGD